MSTQPEQLRTNPENNFEAASESAREQAERLNAKHETIGERSPEHGKKTAERARHEARELAVSVEAGGMEKKRGYDSSPAVRRGPISKREKDASYQRTMKQVQSEMSASSRTFSKLIHNKAVEKTSDALGSTVARPNAILAGAFVAFIVTIVVYYIAKNIGYRLSGFETIGAFIAGWIIGILFDYFRVMVTGKRS